MVSEIVTRIKFRFEGKIIRNAWRHSRLEWIGKSAEAPTPAASAAGWAAGLTCTCTYTRESTKTRCRGSKQYFSALFRVVWCMRARRPVCFLWAFCLRFGGCPASVNQAMIYVAIALAELPAVLHPATSSPNAPNFFVCVCGGHTAPCLAAEMVYWG